MSNGQSSGATGRTNTIITALASVLAAVIVAGGGIIAATIHAKNEAQGETVKLRQQLTVAKNETESLHATVTGLEQRLKIGGVPTPADSQEEDGFAFSRPLCDRAGLVVTCQFKITNMGAARRMRPHARPDLFHNSRALTDQGPLINANGAVLAGVEGPMPELNVPSRVTIPASVKFRDVPPEVRTFTVLTIGFEINIDDHEVEFRDVPLK
jgi:hypothetical protein